MILTYDTVGLSAEADHDVPELTIVHIDAALPVDGLQVDAKLVALLDVVVEECGEQVVCACDGVEVTGEMKVQILHRYDLRISAAGCAALDAEARSEGRLTQCDHGLLSEQVQCIGETDRRRGLSLTGRCRIDRGDQNELSVRPILDLIPEIVAQLRLVLSVLLEFIRLDTIRSRYVCDAIHRRFLCNLNVRLHLLPLSLIAYSVYISRGRPLKSSIIPDISASGALRKDNASGGASSCSIRCTNDQ